MTTPTNYTGDSFGMLMGALRGYRVWTAKKTPIEKDGDPMFRLYSLNSERWDGPEMTAQCRKAAWITKEVGHASSPDKNCTCGIYACHEPKGDFTNLVQERPSYDGTTRIAGVVEGTGRIVVGHYGFRSEHMRIVALVKPVFPSHQMRYTIINLTWFHYSLSYVNYGMPPGVEVRVQLALDNGRLMDLNFRYSEEMIMGYGRYVSLDDLVLEDVSKHMTAFFAREDIPRQESSIQALADFYQVPVLENLEEMTEKLPPISVEHLLPKKKSRIEGLAGFSVGGPLTSSQWNWPLNQSILTGTWATSGLSAAAAASASAMRDFNTALNAHYYPQYAQPSLSLPQIDSQKLLEDWSRLTAEMVLNNSIKEQKDAPKPTWKKKIPRRWRGK